MLSRQAKHIKLAEKSPAVHVSLPKNHSKGHGNPIQSRPKMRKTLRTIARPSWSAAPAVAKWAILLECIKMGKRLAGHSLPARRRISSFGSSQD